MPENFCENPFMKPLGGVDSGGSNTSELSSAMDTLVEVEWHKKALLTKLVVL